MSDKPNAIPVIDRAHAPVVYFEEAPALAHVNGLIAVTLSMGLQTIGSAPDVVKADKVVSAYLRTNIVGARLLRDALDKALLLAEPTKTLQN